MSNAQRSLIYKIIKCLSILFIVFGCVHPASVQAYSPVITESVQNSQQDSKKTVSVTAHPETHPKENTLEMFIITVFVSILVLFIVGLFHAEHHL